MRFGGQAAYGGKIANNPAQKARFFPIWPQFAKGFDRLLQLHHNQPVVAAICAAALRVPLLPALQMWRNSILPKGAQYAGGPAASSAQLMGPPSVFLARRTTACKARPKCKSRGKPRPFAT